MTSLVFQGEKAASREFTTCPFIRKATCQLIPIFPSPGYQMHINESIPGTRRTLVVVRARRVTARERAWCSGCSQTREQNIFQGKTNVDHLPVLNQTAQEFKKSFSSDNNHGLNILVAFDIVPSLTSDSPAGSTLGCSHSQQKGFRCAQGKAKKAPAVLAQEPQPPAPVWAFSGRAACHPTFCWQICWKVFFFLSHYK